MRVVKDAVFSFDERTNMKQSTQTSRNTFPSLYWLVIFFEFIERGSYYGVMSVLSVYFTDELHFSKPDVGIIKGTIQPLLYFLPILSGTLADRFGYRRALLVAFSFLGAGYMLTSQMTQYAAVFLSMLVLGLGAGTFKPVIPGTIARLTTPENNTLGFGIYYWSINLGAFVVPLFFVPYLKAQFGWNAILVAAGLGTGAMILPTWLGFSEPPIRTTASPNDNDTTTTKPNLLQTLANAFEIIYSPFVLLRLWACRSKIGSIVIPVAITLGIALGSFLYFGASPASPQAVSETRPFFLLFLSLLFMGSQLVMAITSKRKAISPSMFHVFGWGTLVAIGLFFVIFPDLSLFSRILCATISFTLVALFAIDLEDEPKFKDHFRFLLMIFIYAGFWVLYFQMFDSVLWYMKAYVDATSLNRVVNGLLQMLGFSGGWHFDVEHVTVINAGTIILLQLFVSRLVKHTKALPTMIVGIALGTCGMGILALSSNIWVFMLGLVLFSIGEITAHPKFISYVGETAPKSRVAMYMGYQFLYGVIGSSIGSVLGANLYVTYVDKLNSPRSLWLIFTGIGILTILGLILFNGYTNKNRPALVR